MKAKNNGICNKILTIAQNRTRRTQYTMNGWIFSMQNKQKQP